MNTAVWIIQGLLGAFFLMPAFIKLFSSPAKLAEKKIIPEGGNPLPSRIIGGLELLGAIGLIMPWLTGIVPVLTPLAAVGLALVMAGAFLVHVRKKEFKTLPLVITLLLLSVTVAVYRFGVLSA